LVSGIFKKTIPGSLTVKVEETPNSELTSIHPSYLLSTFLQIPRPRPVPGYSETE